MSEPLPRHGRTVKPNPAARRKARHFAMQALYQWAMAGASLNDIEVQFVVDNDMKGTDMEYFRELFRGVPRNVSAIDGHLAPHLDREIKDVTPVELAILRLSAYEMEHRIDVPYKVVINEAVELAKKFGATESHKYVNGVLDKIAQTLRVVEIKR